MTNHNAFGHLLHSLWVCSGSYSTQKKNSVARGLQIFFFSFEFSKSNCRTHTIVVGII